MKIGLKRNKVELAPYSEEWGVIAKKTIDELKEILGETALGIEHVGSTAIIGMDAKPIIDIAIGVASLEDLDVFLPKLNEKGYIYRPKNDGGWQKLLVCGDFENDTRTHHIHTVIYGDTVWNDYIKFRDILNTNPILRDEYKALKTNLKKKYGNDREKYTASKNEFISKVIKEER